jgi:predicted transcriptional regulator
MPRRLGLSPLQRDIMLLLEEAGAETVGTVLATLKITDQNEFNAQVNGLITLGLVRKEESTLVLTERGKVALKT